MSRACPEPRLSQPLSPSPGCAKVPPKNLRIIYAGKRDV